MQPWNLPQDIISIATSHRNNLGLAHDDIDLCDVIQIAFSLCKLPDYTDSQHEPIDVVNCLPFTNFWKNWDSSGKELAIFDDDIKKVRPIIAI